MLEPLLMLTVLNCIFMFSSTMTTCALWWQYRRHRQNCPAHGDPDPKLKVKKSKSEENRIFKIDKKYLAESKLAGKKRDKSDFKTVKDCKKERKEKCVPRKTSSQGILMKSNGDGVKTMEKLTSTENIKHPSPLPSEAKSTVVMEVSTIQKIVQVVDNDPNLPQSRRPKGTLTYRITPENDRKIQLIIENDSSDKPRSAEKE